MEVIVALMLGFGVTVTLIVFGSLAISPFVMVLWNLFVPDVFGLHSITWAQALWLTMLCGLLFRTGSSRVDAK